MLTSGPRSGATVIAGKPVGCRTHLVPSPMHGTTPPLGSDPKTALRSRSSFQLGMLDGLGKRKDRPFRFPQRAFDAASVGDKPARRFGF